MNTVSASEHTELNIINFKKLKRIKHDKLKKIFNSVYWLSIGVTCE